MLPASPTSPSRRRSTGPPGRRDPGPEVRLPLLLLLLLPVHCGVVLDAVHLLVGHSGDPHGDLGRRALCLPEEEPVVRCDVAVVTADSQPEMVSAGVFPGCRVETKPAPIRTAHLDPRM